MKNSRKNSALGSGFAALLALAAQSHAQYGPPTINFCPTGTNYNLNCGGCTYNLTCDVGGTRLTIVANGVKLNGNGKTLYSTGGDAITVTSVGTTISNLNISRPQGHGIRYIRKTNTAPSTEYLYNVAVAWPWYDGVNRVDAPYTSLSIRNSQFNMCWNGFSLYNPDSQGARYIDLFDSWLMEGSRAFGSVNAASQHHYRNHYGDNTNYGVFDFTNWGVSAKAQYYSGNYFTSNSNDGLIVSNDGSNIFYLSGNTGYGSPYDCWSNTGTGVIATDNSWVVSRGCVTNR